MARKYTPAENRIEFTFTPADGIVDWGLTAQVTLPDFKWYSLTFGRPLEGEEPNKQIATFLRQLADTLEAGHQYGPLFKAPAPAPVGKCGWVNPYGFACDLDRGHGTSHYPKTYVG